MANELAKLIVVGIVALAVTYIVVTPGALSIKIGPSGGYLASQDRYMHTTVAESAAVSSSLFQIASVEGTVTDGLDGKTSLTLPFSTEPEWFGRHGRGMIELTVTKGEGSLVVLLDGEEIYRGAAEPGRHYITFDKDRLTGDDVLEIRADRGMAFWSTADYDIRADVKGEIITTVNTTFLTPAKYKKAELLASFDRADGTLTIKVNGKTAYVGEPNTMLNMDLDGLQKSNSIEFIPDTGSSFLIDWAEIRFE